MSFCAVPLHAQHRVRDQPHGKLAVGQLPITESNRNGMSSLAIASTVIERCEASSVSVSQAIFGLLAGRSARKSQARSASMARSARRNAPRLPAPRAQKYAPRTSAARRCAVRRVRRRPARSPCGGGLFLAAGKLNGHGVSRVSGIRRGGESAAPCKFSPARRAVESNRSFGDGLATKPKFRGAPP